ncbi:hypothetical protein [Nocardioides sp. PD653]|uniref:hypothetical protein n=1 Tax=Nocardioides sp. PD653 TaxID=393303 RepID=UPI000A267BE1|nr:hypothetical protein [Nocardioides sp. PD653]
MTTTAKIAAKGCQSTGITEDLAETLHNNLGRKVLAVVELVSEARSEKRSGDESVVLSILTVEPAPNADTENHLRELARSFHYERQLADGQLTIQTGDDIEPKVNDVLAAGAKHRPHPYLASTLSTDDTEHGPVCDVCGLLETAAVHQQDRDRDDADEPLPDPDDEADVDEALEDEDSCPHPGCELTAEHDGDHDPELRTVPDPFAAPAPDPAA